MDGRSPAGARSVSARRPLDIGFLHLEMGLGGAERVVLDAARHLQGVGHRVTMFTARAGPHSEQRGDGTSRHPRPTGGFLAESRGPGVLRAALRGSRGWPTSDRSSLRCRASDST